MSENVNTGEKILSKVTVNELGYKEQHQFVEYPKIGSKDKNPTKELEFNVNNDSRRINLKTIKQSWKYTVSPLPSVILPSSKICKNL